MNAKKQSDDVLELLLKSAVDATERMTNLEHRLCMTDVAVQILVSAHPDKEALKANFIRGYVAVQESAAARRNPKQAFAYEQLLERLFGLVD